MKYDNTIQKQDLKKRKVSAKSTAKLFGGLMLVISPLLFSAGSKVSRLAEKIYTATPPARIKIEYAKGFNIRYYSTYKVLSIINHQEGGADTLQYVLLERKQQIPEGFSSSQVIRIPVRNIIAMSSMHVAMASFAESANSIIGIGDQRYLSSELVRQNKKNGKVKEVGMDASINTELVVSLQPDLMMIWGNPTTKFSSNQMIADAGIPVLPIFEWLESHPLARTEWVKLLGALTNKEDLVNKKFTSVKNQYNKLVQIGRKAKFHPLILTGSPTKGNWLVPDADSYNTQFFKDAGASYKWSGKKAVGSLPLTLETVAPVGLKADYWLNVGHVNSKDELLAKDKRMVHFKPYQTNKIYNYNKKLSQTGANDFWESGGVNPHLILADLIKILHPELLPNHKLVYYKKLQ